MRRLVLRLLISIVLFPLAIAAGSILQLLLATHSSGTFPPPTGSMWEGATVGSLILVSLWLLVWFRTVRWTRRRIVMTILVCVGCVLIPLGIHVCIAGGMVFYGESLISAFMLTLPFQLVLCWCAKRSEEAEALPPWRTSPQSHCSRCLTAFAGGAPGVCRYCSEGSQDGSFARSDG